MVLSSHPFTAQRIYLSLILYLLSADLLLLGNFCSMESGILVSYTFEMNTASALRQYISSSLLMGAVRLVIRRMLCTAYLSASVILCSLHKKSICENKLPKVCFLFRIASLHASTKVS